MSQTPITVTYTLEEVLGEIKQGIKETNQKLDALQKETNQKLNALQSDVGELRGEVKALNARFDAMDIRFDGLDKRLEKVEGTQKNQVWTLITLLGGSLIAVGFRAFFRGINP